MSRKQIAVSFGLLSFLFSFLIWNCGLLPDMSPDAGTLVKTTRRLYVNDPASNDSLARPLFHKGIHFVLQANQSYALHLKTAAIGDRLALYADDNGYWKVWKILDADTSGGEEVFNLQSDRTIPTLFAARFLAFDTAALQRLAPASRPWVRLLPVNPVESHSLKVHLFLIGSLDKLPESSGTPDAASKATFANAFLGKLRELLSKHGIVLSDSSSFEIVQPDIAPVTVSYTATDTALPGNRLPGYVHLYLVNNIYSASLAPGQHIIGFAPREAIDLDQNVNSRVVLSATGTDSIIEMARTTAHEMGHFFGLRHVWATTQDMANDSDLSNTDDGFASTKTCATQPLSKKSVLSSGFEIPGNGGYCFRITGTPFQCSSNTCDPSALKNLMFAFSCSDQDSLTSEQQVFERQNMSIMGAH